MPEIHYSLGRENGSLMMENLEDGEVGGGELGVYMTEIHCIHV